MKRFLLIFSFLIPVLATHAQQQPLPIIFPKPDAAMKKMMERIIDTNTINTVRPYTTIRQLPEFPGGLSKFYEYIFKNTDYPDSAREHKIQGRILVSFIVERDGTLSKIEVIRGLSPDLNAEAIRLMKNSPRWKPGMMDGKAVRVGYYLPIYFRL